MCRLGTIILLLALSLPALAAETTPIDLMNQGRYGEARALLDAQTWPPCYHLLYLGLTDDDAARACSLYQVVAIRYPRSDCDTLARARLWDAKNAGFEVTPIAEWSRALPDIRPLYADVPEAAAPPVITEPEQIAKTEAVKEPEPVEQMDWAYGVEQAAPVDTAKPIPAPEVARVEPAPAPVTPPDKPQASGGHWFIQVGAFANTGNANRLAAKLEQAGYGIKLVPGGTEAKPLLQVRVGGYATRAELNPVIEKLKREYQLPAAVVRD